MRTRTRVEAGIQRGIIQCFRLLGLDPWRQNVGVIACEHRGKVRRFRAGEKGQSDVFALVPPHGRLLCCEVKRPGKWPTDDQVAFMRRVNAKGGFAFWTDSIATSDRIARAVLANPRLLIDMRADGSYDLTDEVT